MSGLLTTEVETQVETKVETQVGAPSDAPIAHAAMIGGAEAGKRLDRALAAFVNDLSRSRLKTLILAGHVAISGRTIRDPSHHVNVGDEVALMVPEATPAVPRPENIPLAVVYEDADIIVIDKPRGLVVHPAAGNWTGTLVNALVAHCGATLSGIGGGRPPRIAPRPPPPPTPPMHVATNNPSPPPPPAHLPPHR